MKKLFFIFIVLIVFDMPIVNAQLIKHQKDKIENLPNFDKRTLRFGFYLGLNNNSYKISYYDQDEWISPIPPDRINDLFVSVDASYGFNLGFVIDYRLHKNISLRFEPGLMSNTKELTFINPYFGGSDPDGLPIYNGTTDVVRKVSSTYMHLPLLLKLSANRYKNIRPYIIGGASFDYNFSSNQDNGKDNYDTVFRTKKNNYMYEVGIGMDFYFYYFKFSPSIRGVFAMNNELVRDDVHHTYKPIDGPERGYPSPWTSPIDYFGTRGIYLNLTFQ